MLKNTINYILNPEKTAGGLYTGSLNCMCASACEDMIETNRHYGKEPNNDHDRIAYHFTISWKREEEVSPEKALEITRKFCKEYLSDYEVVYAAHLDKEHMHTHISFNSVSFQDGRKYRYEDNDWEKKLQPLLDRLCAEQGLHTLEMDTGMPLEEYASDRKRKKRGSKGKGADRKSHSNTSYRNEKEQEYSFSDHVRNDIDSLISSCSDFEEWITEMQKKGYVIKQGTSQKYGPYIAVRTAGMKKFRRTQTLGVDYTVAMIKSRIEALHKPLPEVPMNPDMQFLTGKRTFRCQICYQTQNVYLRKQFARLYRLGIIPGKQLLTYRERKEMLRRLRRVEYELQVIAEHDLQSSGDVAAILLEQESRVEEIEKELKAFRLQMRPYEKMFSVYQKKEALEGAYLLYLEGDQNFRGEAEEYLRLKEETKSYGQSQEELEAWISQAQEKRKELRKSYGAEKEKLEACRELRQEYAKTESQYEPAPDEMLVDMDRDDTVRKQAKNRIL